MNFIKKAVSAAVTIVLSAAVFAQPAAAAVEGNISPRGETSLKGEITVRGKIVPANAYRSDIINPADSAIPTENAVFTWNNVTAEDMRKKSDIKTDKLNEYIERFPYLAGIGDALIKAQNEYSVNLIMLLAIIRLESGNGASMLARTKNNLGGLTSKSGYQQFADKNDCVDYMARLLADKYLDKNGCYHSGYTLSAIARRYCGLPVEWVAKVSSLMLEIQRQLD